MTKYIAYYRVSTAKQGTSGLGLEAQKAEIAKFTKSKSVSVIAEFTEIESGKNNNRPELSKAIELVEKVDGILLIAKLDRLSRDVNFISGLMKAGVSFVACDQENATKFTIHIFAALAEQERDMIGKRTRDALTALKEKGVRLGSPHNLTQEARLKGVAMLKAKALQNPNNVKAAALICSLRQQGKSFSSITAELNNSGFQTSKGKHFQTIQVIRIWESFCERSIIKVA